MSFIQIKTIRFQKNFCSFIKNISTFFDFIKRFYLFIQKFQNQFLRDLSIINYAKDNGIEYLEIPYCDFGKISEILEAFLYNGSDITTKLTREIWTGPSLPLGLPLLD